MSTKLCRKSKKRKYNSRAAALRSGTQRYGTTANAYRCTWCSKWHCTRRHVPQNDNDPAIEQLVEALGIGGR